MRTRVRVALDLHNVHPNPRMGNSAGGVRDVVHAVAMIESPRAASSRSSIRRRGAQGSGRDVRLDADEIVAALPRTVTVLGHRALIRRCVRARPPYLGAVVDEASDCCGRSRAGKRIVAATLQVSPGETAGTQCRCAASIQMIVFACDAGCVIRPAFRAPGILREEHVILSRKTARIGSAGRPPPDLRCLRTRMTGGTDASATGPTITSHLIARAELCFDVARDLLVPLRPHAFGERLVARDGFSLLETGTCFLRMNSTRCTPAIHARIRVAPPEFFVDDWEWAFSDCVTRTIFMRERRNAYARLPV